MTRTGRIEQPLFDPDRATVTLHIRVCELG
jgi:hypothetical protein